MLQGFGIAVSGDKIDESDDSALCAEKSDDECIWISNNEQDNTGEKEGAKRECCNEILEVAESESDNPDDYVQMI